MSPPCAAPGRGALLDSIQKGAKLKKTVTKEPLSASELAQVGGGSGGGGGGGGAAGGSPSGGGRPAGARMFSSSLFVDCLVACANSTSLIKSDVVLLKMQLLMPCWLGLVMPVED